MAVMKPVPELGINVVCIGCAETAGGNTAPATPFLAAVWHADKSLLAACLFCGYCVASSHRVTACLMPSITREFEVYYQPVALCSENSGRRRR
ncbi:hypothetical protein KIF59_17475 [Enterobacter cloacae subsp. cloacae]|nr:hypothetical protein [Enterobacter cloacae subsp. cloacae]